MSIRKQEFYEGAALHLLIRSGALEHVAFQTPFFILNRRYAALLKYSSRGRSPWGFTFTPEEQGQLASNPQSEMVVIGLVCGSDGVAFLPYLDLLKIAPVETVAFRVACYRDHGHQYEISGPRGALTRKVAPSRWQKFLLEDR